MKNRPPGHQPRYPAWTVRFGEDVPELVFAQYGVQTADGSDDRSAGPAVAAAAARFEGPDAPVHLDRAVHRDAHGARDDVLMAYWTDPGSHRRWEERTAAWWSGLDADGPVGHWREVARIPTSHLETLHSGEHHDNGTSHLLPMEVTDVHDYWGAARDRIPASAKEPLAGELSTFIPGTEAETRGRRVGVRPPGEVCLIRTAQDWSRCEDAERATYLEQVEPVLRAGAEFLAGHPETGCVSSRYVREVGPDGTPLDKTCVLAWFLSLGTLESWTLAHPTHVDIYGAFMRMLAVHDFDLRLALWHEVSVLPAGALEAEYVNCHPDTGFLRLANAEAVIRL